MEEYKMSRKGAASAFGSTIPAPTDLITSPTSNIPLTTINPPTQPPTFKPITTNKPNIPSDFDPYTSQFKPVAPPKQPPPSQPDKQPLIPPQSQSSRPSPTNLESQPPLTQQVHDIQDDLKKHKRTARILFAISAIMWLLLLLLIGSYIGTTITTANKSLPNLGCLECNGKDAIIDGTLTVNDIQLLNQTSDTFFDLFLFLNNITAASLPCAHCAPNGTFIVDNDMIVNGDAFLYGNTTANQISLLNTTSDMYFDLFTYLNGLNVSSLPCAYCAPNGTFVITGDTIITGNGTLTVDYISLLNTTSDTYFDVFTAIDRLLNLPVENCTVIQVCGPSGNVTAALAQAAALNPNSTNNVGIEFCPGTYIIDNSAGPLNVPSYVSISSKVPGAASLTPSTTGFAIFNLQGVHNVFGFEFYNGLNAPYITQSGFVASGITVIAACIMRNGYGLYESASSGGIFHEVMVRDCDLIADNGLPTKIFTFDHTGEAFMNNVIMRHVPGGFGVGIYVSSVTCITSATDITFIGFSTGIYVAATTVSISIDQLYASDISYTVINIPTIAPGLTEIFLSDIVVDDMYGTVASIYQIDTSETYTYQFGDVQHYNCTSGPKPINVDAIYMDISQNEGSVFRALTDVSVGVPEKPQSTYMGTGRYSSREFIVYYRDPLGVFSRVDTILCSGSTYTLPPDLGGMLYMAVDLTDPTTGLPFQHYGQLFNIITPMVLGGSVMTLEYYDGFNWHDVLHMHYQYAYPYTPITAFFAFAITGSSITNFNWQMKTGYFFYGLPYDPWGLGNDPGYTRPLYWVRYVINVAPLSVSPEISYMGYTGNTIENTDYGFTLYHGFARRVGEVVFSSALFQPEIGGASFGDYTLNFGLPGVYSGFSDAVMPFGTNSIRGLNFNIPLDADISCAFNITMTYIPPVAADGFISLYIGQTATKVGDDPSSVVPIFFSVIVPITGTLTANTQQLFSTTIYLPDTQVYETVLGETVGWLFLMRLAGTDPQDTYPGDINIIALSMFYVKRMEGGTLLL